jgi:hypothetical protein
VINIKDCYYFSHDSNAKDDPKCVMLIEQLGPEGYGIFWILIEMLRDQPSYKYPVALIPALSRRYNTTAEKMKTVVNSYGLFEVDEENFFSLSLMSRMGKMNEIKQKRSNAGKMSARKRILLNEVSTSVEQVLNKSSTSVEQVKEKKVKEIKVKEKKNTYSDFVTLTTTEHERLVKEFGQSATDRMIEILDNYKGANGKKYADDNRAIRNWVVKRYLEEQGQQKLFSKPETESVADKARRLQERYEQRHGNQTHSTNQGNISLIED